MNGPSSESHSYPIDRNTYTDDLAAWTEAAFDLFINFKKVRNCLRQHEITQKSEPLQSGQIGQCSKEQILTLLTVMQSELDTLLLELEQLSKGSQAYYKKNHTRLLTQTASLNQLNQEAKRKLLLTTLSTS